MESLEWQVATKAPLIQLCDSNCCCSLTSSFASNPARLSPSCFERQRQSSAGSANQRIYHALDEISNLSFQRLMDADADGGVLAQRVRACLGLTEPDLHLNHFTEDSSERTPVFAQYSRLRALNMQGEPIGDSRASALIEHARRHAKSINMQWACISCRGKRALADLTADAEVQLARWFRHIPFLH